MKLFWFVSLMLVFMVGVVQAQESRCSIVDNSSPICQLPLLSTQQAEQGFIVATGRWDKDLYPKNSEMEITCVRARVSILSNSSVGFCLMALGFIMDTVPNLVPENNRIVGVSTDYYDIVSWGKTRIIAEKTFHEACPESRQLVIDFSSGTVVLTSTVSVTKACASVLKGIDKKLESVEVYSLKHAPFTLYADEGLNPANRVSGVAPPSPLSCTGVAPEPYFSLPGSAADGCATWVGCRTELHPLPR